MKPEDRLIQESPLYQGADEQVNYSLTSTPWGSTPTSVVAKIYLIDSGTYTDYSTTCFGATTSTVTGDVISLPTVQNIVSGNRYRMEVKFTDSGGNIWEPYVIIEGQR